MLTVYFTDEVGLMILKNHTILQAQDIVTYDPQRFKIAPPDTDGICSVIPHPEKQELASFISRLKTMSPKLGIIFSYSRILSKTLIDIFPNGVANIHYAKLPEYRGANTLQWAIINGEKETAVSLHYVNEGIDTGPVIDMRTVPIATSDTALDVQSKLNTEAAGLIAVWLPKLKAGTVQAIPQDETHARHWPRRGPEDGKIDWSMSDEQISNLTRALVKPWPGAYYFDPSNRKVVISKAMTPQDIERLRREVCP